MYKRSEVNHKKLKDYQHIVQNFTLVCHLQKMKKKTFPYNAVGKAQATEFAKTMGGSMKNNPGYGMEKSY